MAIESGESELPAGLLDEGGGAKLHIGGKIRKAGWEVMNALPGEHVDHLGDIRDLSRFADGTFQAVYGSHILEHLGYARDLPAVVTGVARILAPGGRFFVSVPDLSVLAKQFSAPGVSGDTRFALMRMMFGGQIDEYDFHHVGLWDDYLAAVLFRCGFTEAYRVPRFGIFEDTSDYAFGGELISLNMVAVR